MKVNSSFLLNQFLINGFRSPFTFRFDKNQNGGGFMLYIIEDITFNTFMRIHLDNRYLLLNDDLPQYTRILMTKLKKYLLR